MNKYHIATTMTISVHTVVEAGCESEARRIAELRPIGTIIDTSEDSEAWVTSGELDGWPVLESYTVELHARD